MAASRVHLTALALAFCVGFFAVHKSSAQKSPKYGLDIIFVGNCSADQNTPNYVTNVKLVKPTPNTIMFSMDIVVTYSPPNQQVVVTFFRCTNRDAKDCERFIRVPLAKVCDLIKAKNQFWTPMMEAIHPPMDCPNIATGTYKLINATMDTAKLMETAKSVPDITSFVWKQDLSFVGKKKTFFCYSLVTKVYKLKH